MATEKIPGNSERDLGVEQALNYCFESYRSPRAFSIAQQLLNLPEILEFGIRVNTDICGDHIELPSKLQTIIRFLDQPESGDIILNTCRNQLSTGSEQECVGFLTALTNYWVMLDTRSYSNLFSDKNTGNFPFSPYEKFHEILKRLNLNETQELATRFNAFYSSFTSPTTENIDGISFSLKEFSRYNLRLLSGCCQNQKLSPAEAGQRLAHLAESFNFTPSIVREYYHQIRALALANPILYGEIYEEFCIELSIIGVLPRARRQRLDSRELFDLYSEKTVLQNALFVLEKNPLIDAADHQWNQFTKEDQPPTVNISLGSYAPYTNGHFAFQYLIDNFWKYFQSSLPHPWINLIAPIPDAKNIPGYPKSFATIDTVRHRVVCIILNLLLRPPDFCERTFITTTLSPNPSHGIITNSISEIIKNLEKIAPTRINSKLCIGSDEIIYNSDKRTVLPLSEQPDKIKAFDCVMVTRQGDLTLLADNLLRLWQMGIKKVILGRGNQSSSSDIRKKIEEGIAPVPLAIAEQHFANGCYTSGAFRGRTSLLVEAYRGMDKHPTPSVTDLGQYAHTILSYFLELIEDTQ